MEKKFVILFCASLFLATSFSWTQVSNVRKRHYYELLGSVGITNYFGDIGGAETVVSRWERYKDFDITGTRPMASVGLRYFIGKYLAVSAYLSPAWIAGNDEYSINSEREARFETILIEGTGHLEIYLTPFSKKSRPYIFGGGGGVAWLSNNVFKDADNRDIRLRNTWSYCVGIGFKREIEYFYSVGFNVGAHYITSDYIDGIKGGTKFDDIYFFTQIEFCVKLARKKIYDGKGFVK